jgi:hypothetical protein
VQVKALHAGLTLQQLATNFLNSADVQIDAIGELGRAQLLLNFADSTENKAQVASDWLLT